MLAAKASALLSSSYAYSPCMDLSSPMADSTSDGSTEVSLLMMTRRPIEMQKDQDEVNRTVASCFPRRSQSRCTPPTCASATAHSAYLVSHPPPSASGRQVRLCEARKGNDRKLKFFQSQPEPPPAPSPRCGDLSRASELDTLSDKLTCSNQDHSDASTDGVHPPNVQSVIHSSISVEESS